MTSTWKIGDREYTSRLLVGTAKYPSPEIMEQAIAASGAEIVTVAIRRVNLAEASGQNLLAFIRRAGLTVMPNTAGCYTAKEAILTAQLAREALETNLVKLEVIGDPDTLFPDNEGLLEAAKVLLAELPNLLDAVRGKTAGLILTLSDGSVDAGK